MKCGQCGQAHTRCASHKSGNPTEPCSRYPKKGATVCDSHGGKAPQVRARAAVRAEVMNWGLGDSTADPGEILLRLVTQSSARVERYAQWMGDVVRQCDGDLQKALVGEVWVTDDAGVAHKSGEYYRALTKLDGEERDRCANFATKAIAAGLAERQVRLAERQGAMLAAVLQAVMSDPELGATEQQRALVPALLERHVAAISGRAA